MKGDDKIEKQYKITNKPNAQIFKGILSVMKDGSAIMDVNYISYSGIKNKYKTYFDKDGNEIIHKDDKTRYEKEYYDKITNESVQEELLIDKDSYHGCGLAYEYLKKIIQFMKEGKIKIPEKGGRKIWRNIILEVQAMSWSRNFADGYNIDVYSNHDGNIGRHVGNIVLDVVNKDYLMNNYEFKVEVLGMDKTKAYDSLK